MRAFAGHWPGKTLAVWCAPLSRERQALGWRPPDLGPMRQRALSADDDAASEETKRIVTEFPGAIHIYSGWKGNDRCYTAFKAAYKDPRTKHVVVAEPFRGWGIRRYTRHLRALLKTLPYRGHLDAILAMGESGVSFYRSLGFSSHIVFPFIYQSPSDTELPSKPCANPLRFVYVGKFDVRKGLQDLLQALGHLKDLAWNLTIIGDGPRRHELEQLAVSLEIAENVDWNGVVPHDDLVEHLPSFDVAVVPSRFDGWGVVTNEALQAGLTVVVSDRASSNDLVRYSGAGVVFRAGDLYALVDAMRRMINEPEEVAAMKVRAAEYRKAISGERVARYLAEVLDAVSACDRGGRPVPPWSLR